MNMDNTVGSYEELTQTEKSIVIGTLLGDGHLERTSSGAIRLSIGHGVKQREYVDEIYRFLHRWVRTPPKTLFYNDKRFVERQSMYRFKTVCAPAFKIFYRWFYDERSSKRIPSNIAELLDSQALAIWFMDDGSFKDDSRGLLLNTMSFSEVEQKLLQKVLHDKFRIATSLHTLRRWKRIYISAKESHRFVEIIRPYLHEPMLYKIQKFFVNPVTTLPKKA